MDALTQYLASEHRPSVSKDQLMVHAKRASSAFLDSGVPLNESIRALSKEAGLNEEQTLRVVEMANTFTSRSLRCKTQGVPGNIDFDLAEPSKVLGRQHVGFMASSDMEKTASVARLASPMPAHIRDLDLESVFGYSPGHTPSTLEKTAHDRSIEYLDAVDSARDLASRWSAQVSNFELAAHNCQREMLQAVEEGEDPSEVAALMKCAGISAEAFGVLIKGHEGLFKSASRLDVISEPITEHPLYQATLHLSDIEKEISSIRQTASDLQSDHAEITRLKQLILS